jgi:hypothetical protein
LSFLASAALAGAAYAAITGPTRALEAAVFFPGFAPPATSTT